MLAVYWLREYKAQVRESMKECQKALRRSRANALGPVQRELVTSDLERIEGEIERLQEEVDSCKVSKELLKEAFEHEASKDENSKTIGQPIWKKTEAVLKKHGIDKGAAFGGDLQGNAGHKLMQKASTIIDEIKDYMCLPETATTSVVGTDEEVRNRCDLYCQLLKAFDWCMSGLHTRRFCITNDTIIETTNRYVKKAMELCWHLGFNITPKLHCLESHSVYLLKKHRGFADLAEDAGERAHQKEFKRDARLTAQRSHDRWEVMKVLNEAKECNRRVKRKVKQIYEKTKVWAAEKHRLRLLHVQTERRNEEKRNRCKRRSWKVSKC